MLGMSMTVLGKVGVTVLTALTRTGRSRPIFFAYSVLATTTAAAPSEVAQMSSRWSGSLHHRAGQHVLDADLLAVAGVGVLQPVPRVFLTFTAAKSSGVAP